MQGPSNPLIPGRWPTRPALAFRLTASLHLTLDKLLVSPYARCHFRGAPAWHGHSASIGPDKGHKAEVSARSEPEPEPEPEPGANLARMLIVHEREKRVRAEVQEKQARIVEATAEAQRLAIMAQRLALGRALSL